MIPFHPLANIFPLIEGAEFDELVADIALNGLREPITVHEGKVLDGRNRLRACDRTKVAPVFSHLAEGVDPLRFVVSANIVRRHLRESQRALIASRMATLDRGHPSSWGFTQTEAAQALRVSVRAVRQARKILRTAAPELVAEVEAGHVSLLAAEAAAQLGNRQQIALLAKGRRAVVSHAHRRASTGSRGRAEYRELWAKVDRICDALERSDLVDAGGAAHQLSLAIGKIQTERRASDV